MSDFEHVLDSSPSPKQCRECRGKNIGGGKIRVLGHGGGKIHVLGHISKNSSSNWKSDLKNKHQVFNI